MFCFSFEVTVAHYMDKLDISMKKQIQNELIRSRNSMIKEIRREILEKMTFALRSQGVYDHFPTSYLQFFLIKILVQIKQSICIYLNLIVYFHKWFKIV